jgi:hypothetical protein
MPFLQQQGGTQEVENGQLTQCKAFEALAALEEQGNFRNQNARVWSPNGLSNGFMSPSALSNPLRFGQGGGGSNEGGSPLSRQWPQRPLGGVKGSVPTDIPSTPELEATAVANMETSNEELLDASPKDDISANSPVSQPEAQPSIYASISPFTAQQSETQGTKSPTWRSTFSANGNGASKANGHSTSSSEDSIVFKGCDEDLSNKKLPGLGHSSSITNKITTPKDVNVPNGELHHRRQSNRLSSLPIIPSPLGLDRRTEDLSSDGSDLMSPQPILSVPQGQRQGQDEQKGMQMFGLDTRDPMPNGQESRFGTFKSFGFGHGRRPTDPFVDPTDKWSQAQQASPFVTQAQQKFAFHADPDVEVPSTPVFYQQDFESLVGSPKSRGRMPWTPVKEQGNTSVPVLQPYQPATPITPSFQGFNNPAPRMDLPIPPSPLAAAQGQLVHTPRTRARLDAQVDIRGEWIRNEAKAIAELSRLSFAAAQRYQHSGTQEDFDLWQRLAMAYEDATNLEKRQEERRNMFMPHGVKAMKTGVDNVTGDQSAAYSEADGEGHGQGGKLLGFQMAYMERVCAEVKRRDAEKEDEDGEISPAMLDTLSLEEKKALRKHLVTRLESSTAGPKAEVLSESFI